MNDGNIITYELIDAWDPKEPKFIFPNLLSVPEYCKDPAECGITCYSYKIKNGSEDIKKIRKGLESEILGLGYRTLEEFKKEHGERQELVKFLEFKNLMNPFGKNKSRDERLLALGLDLFLASTIISIPAGVITGIEELIEYSTYSGFGNLAGHIARAIGVSVKKGKIEKMEEKFLDSKNKFLSNLKTIAPEIDVDTVYVEKANSLVKRVSMAKFFYVKSRDKRVGVDYGEVNRELMNIYKESLAPIA